MPYLTPQNKHLLFNSETGPKTVGELNFCFTEMLQVYMQNMGESYQTYNDILGALEGAKLELYRRKIAPYEDVKIRENGDVYS